MILQDAGIKLSSVARDILGMSGRAMLPFARQPDLLDTIPGVNKRSAEELIAEIRGDMAQFGSAARLASWAGVCPGHHESAGKSTSGKTRKGSKGLPSTLTEAAKAASRSRGTLPVGPVHPAARSPWPRRPPSPSRTASSSAPSTSSIAVSYDDLGADWFQRRHSPEHQARKLVHQLRNLGYDVELPGTI